jgi:DNA replication and repair protein RecF
MAMLAAALPVHAIDPGVHQLVDGGPSERRRFLDWGVFHVEHQYLELWKRYRRSLGQRNAALKAGANPRELAAWTEPLATAGTAIDAQRRAYVQALAEAVGRFSWSLLEHAVTVEYAPGWSGDRPFADALSDSAARDRLAGSTDVGPHRADLVFRIDDRRVQDEASRGQQKLITAALVLAQATVQRASGEEPSVVLVDDPAAELDAASLERLLAVLENLPAQLIMTALTPEQLPPSANAAVFHVERGEVRAL